MLPVLGYRLLDGMDPHEAGLMLLSDMYQMICGGKMPELEITPRGKPFFRDNPIYFNISHTPKRVACLMDYQPVGLDVEELDRTFSSSLPKKVLSQMEYVQYEQAANSEKIFLHFWVLKEASVKLSGEGLTGYPNNTNFCIEKYPVIDFDGCLFAAMNGEGMICSLTPMRI